MAKAPSKANKSQGGAITGLDFLLAPCEIEGSLVAVSGDEAFIKHKVIGQLKQSLCGEGDAELAWRSLEGAAAEWRDVADAVAGRSLFGGGRQIVLIEEADTFVTRHRDELEDFAGRGGDGIVLLSLKSLPGNTRLAKAIAAGGLHVRCTTPDRGQELAKHRRDAAKWLARRAEAEHGAKIEAAAIDLLFDLLPMSLGVIDQEVARLALLAGQGGVIEQALAKEHVGGWRVRTAWEMIDAAVEGRAAEAIAQLDRLLISGEQPIGLLAQLGSTLRKFAAAAVLVEQAEAEGRRPVLRQALEQAGIVRFKLGDSEKQLRQIGRARAGQLAEWVVESDLAMKSYNSSPQRARIELERLVMRLSREAAPAR